MQLIITDSGEMRGSREYKIHEGGSLVSIRQQYTGK